MKTLIAIVVTAVLAAFSAAAAADTFQSSAHGATATHPALYSFADVYRLTVSGAALDGFPPIAATDTPIRVAVTQPAGAPELQFSIVSLPEPQRWLLLLAGLALALWVARRRLGYSF